MRYWQANGPLSTQTLCNLLTEEKACVPVEEQEESGSKAESSEEPVVQDPPTHFKRMLYHSSGVTACFLAVDKLVNNNDLEFERIQDLFSAFRKQCRDKGRYEKAQTIADKIYHKINNEYNIKMKGREE